MNLDQVKKLINTKINKYKIKKYINSGGFGHVVEALDTNTNELVALKIPIKTSEKNGQKAVNDELKVYKNISNRENGVIEMKLTKHKNMNIIVMDLLGNSLEEYMKKNKKISMKVIILLAIKMIDILKYIHSCGYIHRDLKPDNFAFGHKDNQKLYCIDFGLAKKFVTKDGQHIRFRDDRKFCGTARFSSIASHVYHEQSRKDDLESLGYILVYLFKRKLPWQNIKCEDKHEKYKLIGEQKQKISEEELCSGMSKEFIVFLKYARTLDFDEKPQYTSLKKMFIKLYNSRNYENDLIDHN